MVSFTAILSQRISEKPGGRKKYLAVRRVEEEEEEVVVFTKHSHLRFLLHSYKTDARRRIQRVNTLDVSALSA
jgi:hypothetical protein